MQHLGQFGEHGVVTGVEGTAEELFGSGGVVIQGEEQVIILLKARGR
jgi:hypothetical protein